MTQKIKNVLVIGIGKVGSLVATLAQESGFQTKGIDVTERNNVPFEVIVADIANKEVIKEHLKQADAVISCLPYHLNLNVAHAAHEVGVHYFDLTEDVETTDTIRKLAETSKGVMAPQCGLAPGFIGIVGADLTRLFDSFRSIELRVGALPQSPKGLLGYAFNWSPEGVVNEYLNDCQVIKNGEQKNVPAMQDHEAIVIAGKQLEAYTTSGGLGTMCETFLGKVDELNYKTLRYPGHFNLMRFFFHELLMRDKPVEAGNILVNAKPPVNDDVVYVYAAVEGWKQDRKSEVNGGLYREEFVRSYYPKIIANQEWRAISWTTAASVTAIVELVANGTLAESGFIKQEEIPLKAFFSTKAGSIYNS